MPEAGPGECSEGAVLFSRMPLAETGVQAVAEDKLAGNVGWHRLLAPKQREYVVPARQIVGGDKGIAVRLESSGYLSHETVRVCQVLDDLVGVDDVKGPRNNRGTVVQAGCHYPATLLAGPR